VLQDVKEQDSGTRSLRLNLPDLIPHAAADGVFSIDRKALKALIRAAVTLNKSKAQS
jgi:hypothetical protein